MLLSRMAHLLISCLILLIGLEHLFTFSLDSLALPPRPNSLMLSSSHQPRASEENGGLKYNVTNLCVSLSSGAEVKRNENLKNTKN